jgi:hypothetical protein
MVNSTTVSAIFDMLLNVGLGLAAIFTVLAFLLGALVIAVIIRNIRARKRLRKTVSELAQQDRRLNINTTLTEIEDLLDARNFGISVFETTALVYVKPHAAYKAAQYYEHAALLSKYGKFLTEIAVINRIEKGETEIQVKFEAPRPGSKPRPQLKLAA